MTIGCIVQARMGSTRLPGKSMADIADKPMLQRVLERVARIDGIDKIILVTSYKREDRILMDVARSMSIACYRGDPLNVLDRYYNAATLFGLDHIVRVTADCPLIDPVVCDRVISLYNLGYWDYVSNVHPPTFPDGLDCEVFSYSALESAWKFANEPADLEHVTHYIWKRPSPFRLQNVWADTDYSIHRWTVDTEDDLEWVNYVYTQLGDNFCWRDVLMLSRQHTLPREIRL